MLWYIILTHCLWEPAGSSIKPMYWGNSLVIEVIHEIQYPGGVILHQMFVYIFSNNSIKICLGFINLDNLHN